MSTAIKFPKLDWSEKADEFENSPPEISEEVYKALKEDLDAITKKKAINPHEIQKGLGNNLVGEENINYGGENEYQQHNEKPPTLESDHSFNVDKKFDNFVQNDNFAQREKKINQELDRILQEKSGFSISRVAGYTFMMNKILFLTTFTEFLFQRFDVVTLFLCIVVVLIEIGVFTHKHLYKWLAVLICSLLLDALVLIDISPVSLILFIFQIYRQVILI